MDLKKFEIIKIRESKNIVLKIVANTGETIKKDFLFIVNDCDLEVEIIIKVLVFENASVDLNTILRIEKGAKNTNTNLKIKCLLTSSSSFSKIIPSLEILEDDVKAGHSATISSFNKVDLDYMRSRTIPYKKAKELIIEGFLR